MTKHTKRCTRCERGFEDARPYAQICPECKLTPGTPNHLALDMEKPRRSRKNLFMVEGD